MQGIFHHCTVLFLAENDTYGRIFILLADLPVQRSQIKLHLADEFRLEFSNFQLNGHQTT